MSMEMESEEMHITDSGSKYHRWSGHYISRFNVR